MAIIPTYNITHVDEYKDNGERIPHHEKLPVVVQYKKKTLRELYKAGVLLGIGSDYYGKTATVEIDSLLSNQVFSNKELLNLWSKQTPQLIFPGRKIGEIKEGFESSFIVLKENPLLEFKKRQIELSVKQGKLINP